MVMKTIRVLRAKMVRVVAEQGGDTRCVVVEQQLLCRVYILTLK